MSFDRHPRLREPQRFDADADSRTPGPGEHDDQRGAGIISTVLGVMFFLLFLLFSLQVMVGAYATSAITAGGYDAARFAAQTGNTGAAVAKFNSLGFSNASISISRQGDNIVANITATNPVLLPAAFAGGMPFANVDRQIIIRLEEFQR